MLRAALLGAVLTLAAQPVVAATSQPAPTPIVVVGKDGKKSDPNRIICEKQETTGTRLGARKVCLTAAQWQEKRREHREELERAQKNVGIKNEG